MAETATWKPHEGPQEFSLMQPADVFETLYGGARGGGKTEAGIVWISEPIDHPRYQGLVVRRNADDLSDWVRRSKWMLRATGLETAYKPPIFRFPSGAIVVTGHLKDAEAYTKYQGHEYHRILIEELTQIPTEDRYLQLISSCRSTVDGLDPQVFSTTNPGNVGHGWVKRRFIDPGQPNVPFTDPETGMNRIFIPSTIDDNPTLKEKDPNYVKRIEALKKVDPMLYRAWRFGDWDVFIGQMFGEWRREKHVLTALPPGLKLQDCRRVMAFDWGYSNPACMVWLAVTPPDRNGVQFVYCYREVYVTEKSAEQWGKMLKVFNQYDPVEYAVLPHDCFARKHDENTVASTIAKWCPELSIKEGRTLVTDARANRAAMTHQMLSDSPYGIPYLQILANCTNLIRTLPELVRDDGNPEVVDKNGEDHSFDALSLGLVTLQEDGYYNAPILRHQVQLKIPRQWAADDTGNLATGNFWEDLRKSRQVNDTNAEFPE